MKIYKYRSMKKNREWIQKILKDKVFWFSKWNKLNDPMEGFFRYYPDKHKPAALQEIVAGKDNLGICSFSTNPCDVVLWSYYANNHKGICIEVDADLDRDSEVTLEPVTYEPQIPWLRKHDGTDLTAKEILSMKLNPWKREVELRAFCEGSGRKLKVGEITRVILGVNIKKGDREFVETLIGKECTVKAELDFDRNGVKF